MWDRECSTGGSFHCDVVNVTCKSVPNNLGDRKFLR